MCNPKILGPITSAGKLCTTLFDYGKGLLICSCSPKNKHILVNSNYEAYK